MTKPLDIYPLSQRDDRWGAKPLRRLPETIARYGCYVTCAAMPANQTPDKTADRMREEGFFAVSSSKVLTFEQLPESPYKTTDVTKMFYGPVPQDELAGLLTHLRSELPAILEVRLTLADGSKSQHFVLAVGAWGFNPRNMGIIINDPWTGLQLPLSPAYGQSNAAAIYRIIYLSKK